MLFPVLLAILTGMAGCTKIGTLSDWIGPENLANTDRQNEIIAAAKLFSLRPLVPFKWGFPEPGSISCRGFWYACGIVRIND